MNVTAAAPAILRWEEPAPLRTASRDLANLASEIRARPGKSAVVAEHPNTKEGRRVVASLTAAVKNSRRGFLHPGGTYAVTTRTVTATDGTKTIQVFVCFNLRG